MAPVIAHGLYIGEQRPTPKNTGLESSSSLY